MKRQPHVTHNTTHVTAGDNNQLNVNGETQATNGTYTQIRVYEDLMALIAHNKDLLAIMRDVLQAVKEGRTDGFPFLTFEEVLAEAEHTLHEMTTTAATGREAESQILKESRYGSTNGKPK